jgi:hypothetical protein
MTSLRTAPSGFSDHDAGTALRRGALVGIPAAFVLAAASALLAGFGLGTALAIAAWPAIVAGPFIGAFALVVRAGDEPQPEVVVALPGRDQPAAPVHKAA